jgi:hypothetical protein
MPDENPHIIEITSFWQKELEASPYFSSNGIYLIPYRITWKDIDAAEESIETCTKGFQAQED